MHDTRDVIFDAKQIEFLAYHSERDQPRARLNSSRGFCHLRGEAAMASRFVLAIIAAIQLLDVGHSLRTSTSTQAKGRVFGTCHRRTCITMESSKDFSSLESIDLKERIYLYNTLSKDKQLFTAVDKSKKSVSFYR